MWPAAPEEKGVRVRHHLIMPVLGAALLATACGLALYPEPPSPFPPEPSPPKPPTWSLFGSDITCHGIGNCFVIIQGGRCVCGAPQPAPPAAIIQPLTLRELRARRQREVSL
jgi:hypothetical protein